MLSAHGIAVVIGAEHHANLLGPLSGNFLSLDIWVDDEDGEEAVALLHDLRERDDRGAEALEGDEAPLDAGDAPDDPGRSGDGDADHDDPGSSVQLRIDRRRRTGVVLLLGCFLTFGTAHMSTRAWMRGITLAAVEVVGIMHLRNGRAIGGLSIMAAILTDLIGALWRVRSSPSTLPRARVHHT